MLRRPALGALSVLSLILCGITVVLWVRSYWYYDSITIRLPHPWSHVNLNEVRGRTQLWVHTTWPYPVHAGITSTELTTIESWLPRSIATDRMLHAPIFELHSLDTPRGGKLYVVALPHWLLIGWLAAMPILILWRRVRLKKRISRGLCGSCGYDLRATPGRCSECGWREAGGDAK